MKTHKWGVTAAVAVASFALVSGCTTGPTAPTTPPTSSNPATTASSPAPATSAAPVTISFMGWGTPQEVDTFNAMIAQFETKYPNVKVEYTSVAATDFPTKLQTMIAGKQVPDVFYLQPESVMPFAKNGIIWDMTSYVANNDIFKQDNVWAKALDMYRYDGKTPGVGAIYGLPKDIGPFALAYNKDMFTAAGIPIPDAKTPWTWDQFVQYTQKLTTGSGTDKVYGTAPYSLESAIWSSGADWLNADHTKVTITDPKFTTAMQWVADLILKYHVAPTVDEQSSMDMNQQFIDQKVAMLGIGPWTQSQFWSDVKFNWDIMPWPVPSAGDKPAIWYGGMGFAVSNSSQHKEEAANLAAFLAFNEDAQRTSMQKGQSIPNLIDMTMNEYMTNGKPPANKQVFLDIIQDWGRRATQTYTYPTDWFFTEFGANASAVWTGDMTAVDFAAKEQPIMQQMIDAGLAEQGQ